ncbi:MAG TPA: hypothetical protein VGX25_03910 [Actinophytocola sp.]|uniref:hypothetical protein n=1 Tax=Actinophytocola sp. TaxID=1872138 RepID=UPI002DDD1293|nr:hypothetical protein [Actinophytocola sp.]HEV2778523.1 hypothetical protein [Actinophytocola sp.]
MYEVTTDEQSQAQIDALPADALAPFAEARAVLELVPWNGLPYHRRQPDSSMRTLTFGPSGEGKIVYLILEDQCRVDLLVVLWLA